MIADLIMWLYRLQRPFLIKDERFAKRVGVRNQMAPDFREEFLILLTKFESAAVRFMVGIIAVCGTMQKVDFIQKTTCDAYHGYGRNVIRKPE